MDFISRFIGDTISPNSILNRKEISEHSLILLHFIDLQTTPSYNDMKHKNRNGIDVEEAESLDLVTSPESNSSCLVVQIEL